MEVDQEDKETVTKSTNEATVTQEPATEVEQFHPQEVVTPSIDSACGRTPGLDDGWCSEKMLLLPELQKWKQQALSPQEGAILLQAHKNLMDCLREKWLKEEREREWESRGTRKL